MVSDLTYVRVGAKWNYICVLVGPFNREIIGYSAGEHKTAELVKEAFQSAEAQTKLQTVEHQFETAKVEVEKPFAQEAELAEIKAKLEAMKVRAAGGNMDKPAIQKK